MSSVITSSVPAARLVDANDAPARPERDYVLYWCTASRRSRESFALDFAVDAANALDKPLLVLEALRVGYPYASDRLHRFILDGMAETAEDASARGVTWLSYVEPTHGAGSGLVESLAKRAAYVITDDYPCFFLPRMVHALAARVDVRVVKVDGNGVLPMRVVPGFAQTAYHFRQRIQKLLPAHLGVRPSATPLARLARKRADVGAALLARFPMQTPASLRDPELVRALPIDHGVPVAPLAGGMASAERTLAAFVAQRLPRYAERNHPDEDATSRLSPFLHFGHLSAHRVVHAVLGAGFDASELVANGGKREGYYGLAPEREAFLDQIVTWRELGFHFCLHEPAYDRYETLPEWARRSLAAHTKDARAFTYDLATLESARTHDEVWNAAQRELVQTGVMHNYLRMLWGKKILEWSRTPEEAFRTMIELNDRYALDGRDPNSYSGMGWVLGRFDRPWAPERPIFGQIRYMSSDAAVKKLDMKAYLARYGRTPSLF